MTTVNWKGTTTTKCHWQRAWTGKFKATDSFQSSDMPTKYRKAGQSQQRGLELEGRSICEMAVKPTKFLEVWSYSQ